MRKMSDRTIKVNKDSLIKKIKENKKNHQKEFTKAVEAYRVEAVRQLESNLKRIDSKKNIEDLQVKTNLIVPVDRTKEYDKLITQFEWELDSEVELSQREFNQYIHDETDWAVSAKFANTSYVK